MRSTGLRARILLAIGASGAVAVACGGETGVDTDTRDATTDHGIEGDHEGGYDAALLFDAAQDAPSDGAQVFDTAIPIFGDAMCSTDGAPLVPEGGACVPYGGHCQETSDCCNGVACTSNGFSPCAGECGCICYLSIRRPFLVGSSLRSANTASRADWQLEVADREKAHDLDAATAHALAHAWLRDGCEEHASIAAFARFTMHLLAVGAPPEMILASQAASRDEVRHARACFALASRYAKRSLGPGSLSLEGAMPTMTLAEIAALTAEEGCVGETLGALLAEEQARAATDPHVRAVLAKANIVRDEARHAELAWSFVRWAIARGGAPVRRAVAAAIRRAVARTLDMEIKSYEGIDVAAWRAHGRLTCADARALAERGVREIVLPCAAALLDRSASSAHEDLDA
jgi:hypothetical protein